MKTAEVVENVRTLSGLSLIWLEITAKCNLECSHCYADSAPQGELYGSMSFVDWVKVIDEAAELDCRRIQFIGGEPTIHPRLDDLVDHANHRGFEFIEVFTNATRLDRELLACFHRNSVHVATSFYADDPAVHEEVTRVRGSWCRTVAGIRALLSAGLPLRVGVIETERNAGHGQRAIDFVRSLGVEDVGMDHERGVGRGGRLQPSGGEERYDQLCGQCWNGKLCVTPSGECFPCVFSRATHLGDARCGLGTILASSKLLSFRTKVRQMGLVTGCLPNNPYPQPCFPGSTPPNPCAPHTCGPGTGPCYPLGRGG
jgi:hypothetical protein